MDTTEADARDRADMERLAAGHEAALNELMDRHATAVFHFLCRMLGNEDDANDLAQETFVRVFQARNKFDATRRFSTWMFTIAANLARNQIRWRTRHPNVSLEAAAGQSETGLTHSLASPVVGPDEQLQASERIAAVRAAMDQLTAELREAIVLCEWEEKSMAEAAQILNLTPKAVESRCYRARQILRDRLKVWL